jgi:hypothetical protein
LNKYTRKLESADGALQLCRKHSIDAVSKPVGYAEGYTRQLGDEEEAFAKFRQTSMKTSQKICSINLLLKLSHNLSGVDCGAAGSLRVNASVGADDDGVPAYFLPWDERGGTVQMTIPSGAGNDYKAHPQIFFTAALSGCSVIVKGTASNPTIIHAGSGQLPLPYDANQFWKDFVEHLDSHPDPAIRHARRGPVVAQATKQEYVAGPGVTRQEERTVLKGPEKVPVKYTVDIKTTQHAIDFKRKLSDHYGDELEIVDVTPWGAVFGIRRGGNWTFYLQENANIEYYPRRKIQQVLEYTRGAPMMLPDKWIRMMGPVHRVSRPMAVTQYFPAGNGAATLTKRWRSLVRTDKITDAPNAYAIDG